MPSPHTTAASPVLDAAEPATAASKLLPSEALAVLPPAAPASPPPPARSSAAASPSLVSAAALAAIADIESVGEASGDADAVAELIAGLEGETIKVKYKREE
jgi:hypothetical protein